MLRPVLRASYATFELIRRFPLKNTAMPTCTTAYLLLGEKCTGSCSFCIRSSSDSSSRKLSRITWPDIELSISELTEKINSIEDFKRICLQVTKGCQDTIPVIAELASGLRKPISLSCFPDSIEQAEDLLNIPGLDYLALSIDCVSNNLYKMIKGACLQETLDYISKLSMLHPGKIRTHLIAGLGETEEEMVQIMSCLVKAGIKWGLFSFFPIPGTPMQDHKRLPISRYRVIQLASWILSYKKELNSVILKEGKIMKFNLAEDELLSLINSGKPFQTTGCPSCNRPYYNEKPSEEPYNFHRPPSDQEIRKICTDLTNEGLINGC